MWNRLPGAVCSWKVVRFVSLAAMATTSMPDFEFETTNLDRSLRSSSFSTLPLTWKVSFAISTQRLFPIQTIQYHLFNATNKEHGFLFCNFMRKIRIEYIFYNNGKCVLRRWNEFYEFIIFDLIETKKMTDLPAERFVR